jgi:hypothetical protein
VTTTQQTNQSLLPTKIMSTQQQPQDKEKQRQEVIDGIINTQNRHTNEINSLLAVINKQQDIIQNRDTAMHGLVDNIVTVQKQANQLQNMQKQLITTVKQKIDTQKCTDLNLIIEQQQVKNMQKQQKTMQTITNKLTEIAFSHKQLLSLNKKVDNLQKQQTNHSEILKAKIDTRKCIELNTNIGRQQQTQKDKYQDDMHHLTTQLSQIVINQNQKSTITQADIDNQAIIKRTQKEQQVSQDKLQKNQELLDNKISKLTAKMDNIQPNAEPRTSSPTQDVTPPLRDTEHAPEEQKMDKTTILIQDIRSTLSSDATTQAFCNQFQIPQICFADSYTSWTNNNTLRITMQNAKIAETVRRAIAFQMRLKIIKQGYTTNMFKRCHLPRVWLLPNNNIN